VLRGAQKERRARRENGEAKQAEKEPPLPKEPEGDPPVLGARAPGVFPRRGGGVPGPRVSAPGPTQWRRGRSGERERGGGAGAFFSPSPFGASPSSRRFDGCAGHALSPEASSGSC
jgi:hypothetical protein